MLYCHCGKGYHYCHANYFNICCVKKGNIRKRDSVGIASLTYGTEFLSVHHAAVQTTESSHPRALRRVWLWGASESRGAGGTLPPGRAHQEPPGQIQVGSSQIIPLELGCFLFLVKDFTSGLCLCPFVFLSICVFSTASRTYSRHRCWTSVSWTRLYSSRRGSWTCPKHWPPRPHARANWLQVSALTPSLTSCIPQPGKQKNMFSPFS